METLLALFLNGTAPALYADTVTLGSIMDEENADHISKAMINSATDAILTRYLDGTITSINPAGEKMFGFSREQMIGKNIDQIIPEQLAAEQAEIHQKLEAGTPIPCLETVRQRLDGAPVFVSVQISPIVENNRPIGASEIYRDISERIRAETALAEMTKRSDEYVSHMAHDLRTPMNAIVGLVSLLSTSWSLSEKEKKFVDTLKTSADDLVKLMGEFFERTRSEHHLLAKNTSHLRAIETFQMADQPISKVSHKNVLLVEDYAPSVLMAEAMLDQLGYDYDTANSGLDALNRLLIGSYDVVLMDIEMGDLDGLEATRKLRELEKQHDLNYTPVIAMTASIREKDQHACQAAGMDDFIPKPFHPSDLALKLSRHIPSLERKTAR